jgi:hypothetical protein
VWQAKPVASAVAFNDAACHAVRLAHTQVVAATALEQRMVDPALFTRGRSESSALTRKRKQKNERKYSHLLSDCKSPRGSVVCGSFFFIKRLQDCKGKRSNVCLDMCLASIPTAASPGASGGGRGNNARATFTCVSDTKNEQRSGSDNQ